MKKTKLDSSSSDDEEDVSRFASVAVDGMTVLTNAEVPHRAKSSHLSREKSSKYVNIGGKNLEIALEKRMDSIWASTYLWTEEERLKACSQHLNDQGKKSGNDAVGMKLFRGGPHLTRCDTLGDVPLGGGSRHLVRKVQRRQLDKPRKSVPLDLRLSGVVVTAEEVQQCYKKSLEISSPRIGRQSIGKAKMRRLMRDARLYGHSLNCDDE